MGDPKATEIPDAAAADRTSLLRASNYQQRLWGLVTGATTNPHSRLYS